MAASTYYNDNLCNKIKQRRIELGLTTEEAAHLAGIETKIWERYEAGRPIRIEKRESICKVLGWSKLPGEDEIDLSVYKESDGWSSYLEENYGILAALLFASGSDILLDTLENEIYELSTMPASSHIGQISHSTLKDELPQQFLMNYNYEFLYKLRSVLISLRIDASNNQSMVAHSVAAELLIYISNEIGKNVTATDENVERLIAENELLYANLPSDLDDEECEEMASCCDEDWVFELFDDSDIVFNLYSEYTLTEDNSYHYSHWFEDQFYI